MSGWVNKADGRRQILAERSALSAACRRQESALLCERLWAALKRRSVRSVAAFLPFGDEIDLLPLLRRLQPTTSIYLPRVVAGRRLLWGALPTSGDCPPTDWPVNRMGIVEPPETQCLAVLPETIEVILTPCVGVNDQGDRLGYGGGYYDGVLKQVNGRAAIWAIGYDLQYRTERWPVEPHDQRVEVFFTPHGVWRFEAS